MGDFKDKFYNLQGIHIDERKKNLYILLKSTPLNMPEHELNISPRNYQEKIFYVDVLLHFKKIPELVELLKENVGIITSKILKYPWVFKEALTDMSNKDIVEKFLPTLGYSLRMKVLKRISEVFAGERMDELFDLILERYGIFIAKNFLYNCTTEKCIKVIKENDLNLSSSHLKRLLQKDPVLVNLYWETSKTNTGVEYDDYSFIDYVVWKNPELFYKFETCKKVRRIGRLTVKKLLVLNEKALINDFDKYQGQINIKHVKGIKKFDEIIIPKYFPGNRVNLDWPSYKMNSVMQCFSKKKRWDRLASIYQSLYNEDITNDLKIFSSYVDFFPKEIRIKWAKIKYGENEQADFLKYYDSAKGSKLIKEKINFTSDIYERKTLLSNLICLCSINKDSDLFDNVLKYICKRHRNDDKTVRDVINREVFKVVESGITLTRSHWTSIEEIIDVQRAKRQTVPTDLLSKYLIFLQENNLPLEEAVQLYVKDMKSWSSFRLPGKVNRETENAILRVMGHVLSSGSTEANDEIRRFIKDIVDFNMSDKQYKIDLNEFPRLVKFMTDICAKVQFHSSAEEDTLSDILKALMQYNHDYPEKQLQVCNETVLFGLIKSTNKDLYSLCNFFRNIKDLMLHKQRTPFENNLMHFLLNECLGTSYSNSLSILPYFFEKEPSIIVEYLKLILQNSSLSYKFPCEIIKRYSHLNLDSSFIDHFKSKISSTEKADELKDIFEKLSQIMSTTDYLELTKKYIPTSKKLNLENRDQLELYKVQCSVVASFTDLDEYLKIGDTVMHYCRGDYLSFSLPVLYKMMYRIDENRVGRYINVLGQRAVSTRKHATVFAFELLPVKLAVGTYSSLSAKETNDSAKKSSIKCILHYFIKTSLDSLLDTVIDNIKSIDKNDTELMSTFIEAIDDFPYKYKAIFIEKLWKFFESLKQKNTYHRKLLYVVGHLHTSVLLTINQHFFQYIIKSYFFSDENSMDSDRSIIFTLVVQYLALYPNNQDFLFIFSIIRKHKRKYWNLEGKSKISDIKTLFSIFYESSTMLDEKFFALFKKHWELHFNPVEAFCQHILLRFMDIYKKKVSVNIFADKINKMYKELLSEYGLFMLDLLKQSTKLFFETDIFGELKNTYNVVNFSLCLLECKTNETNCLIAAYLIKDKADVLEETCSKIYGILKNSNDIAVKIYCSNLLL